MTAVNTCDTKYLSALPLIVLGQISYPQAVENLKLTREKRPDTSSTTPHHPLVSKKLSLFQMELVSHLTDQQFRPALIP